MKKTFILLTAVIATILSTAINTNAQTFNFEKDEEGDPYLSGSISYDCSAKTAMNRLTTYLQTIYDEEHLSVDEETGVVQIKNAQENSKFIYNPLAGEFRDDVVYDLTITPDADSKTFHYTFSKLSIRSFAKGFANYDRCDPLRVVLKKYAKAKERVDDPALDRREKKSAVNDMEDLATSLSKVSETLLALIERAQENIE